MALDPFACVLEVELVAIPDVFGISAVSARGRPNDVDEQDRDELALLLPGCDGQLVAARGAKPRTVGCIRAAATADHA